MNAAPRGAANAPGLPERYPPPGDRCRRNPPLNPDPSGVTVTASARKPDLKMSPDELAIELLTTGQSLTGGRGEALRLLQQVKDQHAHRLAEQIREDSRSTLVQQGGKFHAGEQHAADLIDPEVQR